MAERAVSILVQYLGFVLIEEGRLLHGVDREVRYIKDELDFMRAFLEDADTKAETDKGVKTWVKQVRELVYDVEDVLDKYVLRIVQEYKFKHWSIRFVFRSARFLKELKSRHKLGSQIKEIKERVREIKERRERYNFSSSITPGSNLSLENDLIQDPPVASLFIEETNLVGIEQRREELVGWLLDEEPDRRVLAVVGMGGLGKTTLVKKVYDDRRVNEHFDCQAWVTVSKSFRVQELLKDMIKQFCEARKEPVPADLEAMGRVERLIMAYLQSKRYVIIFDDVWSTDLRFLVEHVFPLNDYGSRIILTTRLTDVASSYARPPNRIYDLQPLSQQDAWELFCKKAFGGDCPQELHELSHKIVDKCQGTPLAIATVGSLLGRKRVKSASEWKQFYDSMGYELDSSPAMKRLLWLSYNDLPHPQKYCFLYISSFPEDYAIECGRLVKLWIAEGLIEEVRGKTPEEVALNYLNELIQRSLVQVAHLNIYGEVSRCRVHDILREIILSKSKDDNFYEVYPEPKTRWQPINARRLSILENSDRVSLNTRNLSRLRTLLMFGIDGFQEKSAKQLLSNFKLLRVLDLQGAPLENFPDEIVTLYHLRYLSLKRTKIRKIPKSLGKLKYLETLDLRRTLVVKLPVRISKLHHLRHLLASNIDNDIDHPAVDVHNGIGRLTALQKLSFIEATEGSSIAEELGSLTQLRTFGIKILGEEDGQNICSSIDKMNDLRSLKLDVKQPKLVDFNLISSPPRLLRRLWLDAKLNNLPYWLSSLENLVYLRLGWSWLRDDPIKVLQSLPKLEELYLNGVYEAEQLHFEAQGFGRLRALEIGVSYNVKSVVMDDGALPVLESLYMSTCEALKQLPLGIQHLRKLKYFSSTNMPNEFDMAILQLDNEQEQDGLNPLQHINKINFGILLDDGRWLYYSKEEYRRTMERLQRQNDSNNISTPEDMFKLTKQTILAGRRQFARYWYEQ
ncbi:PREDICTED: disease resistance protein RPM1-like [Nelumbo nucifera]|uniref:Disease resistance protein RPM1-like n=2 Tax=Nelumbo nucifera TaxID=4432 RepID=A0A1U7ZAG9_NELNU|nr:PREDICTED: disease resistance protein RPM1-like [Nelumbo nucifera]DAD24980.1 TPA_asm: hypothetical protein HUJ06_026444 [Nelumbo nucifera]